MGEGKILVRVSSLFLYCKYLIFRRLASGAGELGNNARRLLAFDCADTQDTEEMETVHTCMTAKGRLYIRRQYHRYPAMIRKTSGGKIQNLTI